MGDVDGDGDADLIISTDPSGPCTSNGATYLNDGQGTLARAAQVPASDCVAPAALPDLDGDGHVDMLETAGVRPGNGDGTFGARVPFDVSGMPITGDFDEDGFLDVALVDGNQVQFLHGNGNGTFAAAQHFEAGSSPAFVRAADLNEDGHLDLIVGTASAAVSILYGDGQGGFGNLRGSPAGASPVAVAVGDLDLDGKADLVVVNPPTNSISTLRGRGDGTFEAPVSYGTGLNPTACALGDLNGDGRLDVAVSNYSSATISVFLAQPNGSLGARIDLPAVADIRSVAIGDVDEDGKLDLVGANGGDVIVLRTTGTGFLQTFEVATAVLPPLGLADVTGDGHLDLVCSPKVVMPGDGHGSFSASGWSLPCDDHCTDYAVTLGDMTQDGIADVAFARDWGDRSYSILMRSFSNQQLDGFFNHPPRSLVIGDFDGDGRADLAAADENALVSMWFNDGAGALGNRLDFGTGRQPNAIVAADFNGDGRLDIATADGGSNAVFVHFGDPAVLGVEEPSEGTLPTAFALSSIFPNPVRGACDIELDMPRGMLSRLRVFDLGGRVVSTVVNGYVSAGQHRIPWNTAGVPSGLYFLRLEAGTFGATQRFAVVRN